MEQLLMVLLDWQFWTAAFALIAIVLSQLPPVNLWFRPTRLDVEVQNRANISHKVGNPNLNLYLSLTNAGGRQTKISKISLEIERDGQHVCTLPAQSYFETLSSKGAVIFVPFVLKPGETWGYTTGFFPSFDRQSEKLYRDSESALRLRIREKLNERNPDDKRDVEAEPHFMTPFLQLFERLFIWKSGEYVAILNVQAIPSGASFSKKFRFTIFESEANELASYKEHYSTGAGLLYNVDRHAGISLPLDELGP